MNINNNLQYSKGFLDGYRDFEDRQKYLSNPIGEKDDLIYKLNLKIEKNKQVAQIMILHLSNFERLNIEKALHLKYEIKSLRELIDFILSDKVNL